MKQVIVVNQQLHLPKGKLAAQVAHAAVGAYLAANEQAQRLWLEEDMPKIVVRVPDEQVLLQLCEQAERTGLPTLMVQDAGKTVLPAGITTCLGISLTLEEQFDQLTGMLALL